MVKTKFFGRAKIEIEYEQIENDDELVQVVDEMKQFARSREFDYERAKLDALASSQMKEVVNLDAGGSDVEVLRTRGKTDLEYMRPWSRFVMIGYETLQLVYTEFQVPEGWMAQLQITNNYKIPLDEGSMKIAELFFPQGQVVVPEGTPPHVVLILQMVER